jgi:LysM repeat protein
VTATPHLTPTVTLVPYRQVSPTPSTGVIPPSSLPGPTLGPAPTPFTHEVQQGETLSGIALRYGVELDDLLAANPGVDPRALSIGQKLIIPGPEGSGSQGFFPTPTPVPLESSPVSCFSDGMEGAWCILDVESSAVGSVEGLAAAISVFDAQGRLLASDVAYTELHFIPEGQQVPVGVRLDVPAGSIATARAEIMRAFAVQDSAERFAPVELTLSAQEPDSDGLAWRVAGTLAVKGAPPAAAARLVLLAMGLDERGEIVGYSVWQHDGQIEAGEAIGFSTRVYSLKGPIETIEVIAQALKVPE